MILVNGANGHQGKLLVPKLVAAGEKVRAWVQSERSAAALRAAGVEEIVVGDIGRPELIASAVRGVDKIYHVCPGVHPREREIGLAMIDAARAEGVRHFVFSSVLHAITTDLVQHVIKRDVEEHLLSSGLDFTILQPTIYMLPLKLKPVFEHGTYPVAWSLERRQSLVHLDDIAEVAAMVLTDSEAHAGATYELVGTGRYTAHQMGEIISSVVGRDIPVTETDVESYLDAWLGDRDRSGLQHQAAVFRSLNARYSSHDFTGNANVLTWLLGRSPTSFEQFVRSQYEAFNRSMPEAVATSA